MSQIVTAKDIITKTYQAGWSKNYVEEKLSSALNINTGSIPSGRCINYSEITNENMTDIVLVNEFSKDYGTYYENNQLVSINDIDIENSKYTLEIPIVYEIVNSDNSCLYKHSFCYDFYSPEDNSIKIATAYSPNENLYSSSESIMNVQMPKIYRNEQDGNFFTVRYIGSKEFNSCNIWFENGDGDVNDAIGNYATFGLYMATYEETLGNGITMTIEIGENEAPPADVIKRTINVRFTNNFDEVQSYYTEISLDGNDFHHLDGQSPTYIGSQAGETKSFTIISNEEENNYLRNNNFYVRISTADTVRFGHCYGNFSKANASPIYVDDTDDTPCTYRIPKWNIDKGEVNLEVEIHEP